MIVFGISLKTRRKRRERNVGPRVGREVIFRVLSPACQGSLFLSRRRVDGSRECLYNGCLPILSSVLVGAFARGPEDQLRGGSSWRRAPAARSISSVSSSRSSSRSCSSALRTT